jgi:hypothetical protein
LIRLRFLILLLLLIAACWSLTGRRFTPALTRSARGIVAEPTLLTGGERLCDRVRSRRAWHLFRLSVGSTNDRAHAIHRA